LYNNISIFPSEEESSLSVFQLPNIPIKASKVHSAHNVGHVHSVYIVHSVYFVHSELF
jgi:hypothetical protein